MDPQAPVWTEIRNPGSTNVRTICQAPGKSLVRCHDPQGGVGFRWRHIYILKKTWFQRSGHASAGLCLVVFGCAWLSVGESGCVCMCLGVFACVCMCLHEFG